MLSSNCLAFLRKLFHQKLKNIRQLRHNYSIALLFIIIYQLAETLVECGGDVGGFRCENGKWQVDTKLVSLIVVCPVDLTWNTLTCALKRLGLYHEGTGLHPDLHIFICSLFDDPKIAVVCRDGFESCLNFWGGLNSLTMIPVGWCLFNKLYPHMNCTV